MEDKNKDYYKKELNECIKRVKDDVENIISVIEEVHLKEIKNNRIFDNDYFKELTLCLVRKFRNVFEK